jgi:hypothetical protein
MIRILMGAISLAVLACPLLWSQQDAPSQRAESTVTAAIKAEPTAPKEAAAAKPTSAPLNEDQQLGRQMLEIAEAAARGLEPPMRSYSLFQIAQAYVSTDKAKAAGLLRDAFTAAVAIPDDKSVKDIKNRLQQMILEALLPLSQSDVEERLYQADPETRRGISDAIVHAYAERKQFAPALELLTRMTAEDEFPYGSGASLIAAMPPDMAGEKQSVFAQAVASFSQHKHPDVNVHGGGLIGMVLRFGTSMPPKLVLEAIDEILKQGKESDTDPASITMSSDAGTVGFSSFYEYELFAFLPLLRQLDESRAKSLLEENQDLAAKIKQFPEAVGSLDPELVGKSAQSENSSKAGNSPKKGRSGMSTSVNSGSKTSPEEAVATFQRHELERQVNDVIDGAAKDPVQAIAQAATLPAAVGDDLFESPRGRALETIAKINAKQHPAIARQAVDELAKTAEDLGPQAQAIYLASAADLYLQLGDSNKAETIVNKGFKAAEKLLEKDSDSDDPNLALKAWWPATDAYRRFIEIETRISHPATVNILKEIKDADIRTVESIIAARTLLGDPQKGYQISRRRKVGDGYSSSSRSWGP